MAPKMKATGPDLVWYGAFGSNVLAERFITYLQGGPVPYSTTGRIQEGARDRTLPVADTTLRLPHRLFFTHSSKAWGGGGVAMLDPESEPTKPMAEPIATTLSRLWLITAEQFEDVFRQENGQRELAEVDLDSVMTAGHQDLLDSWYGRVLYLGPGPDDHPIITLTCHDAKPHAARPAHESYLRVIGLGLMESWGLSAAAAAEYLATRDGNHGVVDVSQLIEALQDPTPKT